MLSEFDNLFEEADGEDTALDEDASDEKSTIDRIQDHLLGVLRLIFDATQGLYNDSEPDTTETSLEDGNHSPEEQTDEIFILHLDGTDRLALNPDEELFNDPVELETAPREVLINPGEEPANEAPAELETASAEALSNPEEPANDPPAELDTARTEVLINLDEEPVNVPPAELDTARTEVLINPDEEPTNDLPGKLETAPTEVLISPDEEPVNDPPAELDTARTEVFIHRTSQLPNPDPPNYRMEANEVKVKSHEKAKDKSSFSVPCRYSTSGCRELVHPGNTSEMNHMKSCAFRPISCFVDGCGEDIPYHSFLIHMHQHFIYPTYGTKLTASIFIRAEDFDTGGIWGPKWLSTQNRHFFLMLQRFERTGLWASWVWMLGKESGAEEFVSKITCFKGTKCISGIYPVHSIRRSADEILKSDNVCLLTSDAMIKTLVRIGEKLVTDMSVHVNISPREEVEEDDDTCCKDLAVLSDPSIMSTTVDSAMTNISTFSSSIKSALADISTFVNSISTKLTAISESNP